MKRVFTTIIGISGFVLAACGTTTKERALSGGAIGAGTGAAAGELLADEPVGGAVLGGVAGAATGTVTEEEDINLEDTFDFND